MIFCILARLARTLTGRASTLVITMIKRRGQHMRQLTTCPCLQRFHRILQTGNTDLHAMRGKILHHAMSGTGRDQHLDSLQGCRQVFGSLAQGLLYFQLHQFNRLLNHSIDHTCKGKTTTAARMVGNGSAVLGSECNKCHVKKMRCASQTGAPNNLSVNFTYHAAACTCTM